MRVPFLPYIYYILGTFGTRFREELFPEKIREF
nr:MAG TPA: hypothetical protein [Caudoviricetes sp.]